MVDYISQWMTVKEARCSTEGLHPVDQSIVRPDTFPLSTLPDLYLQKRVFVILLLLGHTPNKSVTLHTNIWRQVSMLVQVHTHTHIDTYTHIHTYTPSPDRYGDKLSWKGKDGTVRNTLLLCEVSPPSMSDMATLYNCILDLFLQDKIGGCQ